MNSSALQNFSTWHRWGPKAVSQAPQRPGVYAFRLIGKSFGRFKGESDVVYIGCATDGTISSRLRTHISDRTDSLDIGRRLRDPTMGEFEVAWRVLGVQEASKEEAKLLREYYWDHAELPPDNRSEPFREIRLVIEGVVRWLQTLDTYRGRTLEYIRKDAEKLVDIIPRLAAEDGS